MRICMCAFTVMNVTFLLSCVTSCGRPEDDEVMEMLGGHDHCDA